jgi:hypothetical protein
MRAVAAVLRALHGAWRLLLLDSRGLAAFDGTPKGALASFWAMLVVLPLDLAVRAIALSVPVGDTDSEPPGIGLHLALYVIDWLVPVALVFILVRWYGRGDRFWLFLSALNWSQVLQSVGTLLVQALLAATTSLVDVSAVANAPPLNAVVGALAALMAMAIFVLIYAYEWYVSWVSLEAGIALPTIVVLLDLVTGASLSKLVTMLL